MKTMIRVLAGVCLLAPIGCLTATVTEPSGCDTQTISFPINQSYAALEQQIPSQAMQYLPDGLTTLCSADASQVPPQAAALLPASWQLPPQSTTQSFDFSKTLSDVKDVAKQLNVDITQLSLTNPNNELSFVSSVEVFIQSGDDDAGNGQLLASYTAPDAGVPSQVNVQVRLPADQVLSLLEAGPVTLSFILNSNPVTLNNVCQLLNAGYLNSAATMCVSASGTFSHSL
jgi:hypothetical protein